MTILITGANGFLGYYLTAQLLEKGHNVIATGKGECRLPFDSNKHFRYNTMDITDPFSVHDVFTKTKPEAVVHAAAMTQVDTCELEQWEAYRANVEGTVTTLLNAEEHKSFFVFVSTDFVFDGQKGMYSEDDDRAPVNFYGKTKMEAEEAVKEYEHGWAIARTVLVYGKPLAGGTNILTVVREKLQKGEEYKLVTDQVRTPTYVGDLANGIISILERKATGIYHLSGKDILTPYEMGVMVAEHLKLDASLLKKVNADTFSQPAKRPPKTGFNIEKARFKLGYEPISFEQGLRLSLEIKN